MHRPDTVSTLAALESKDAEEVAVAMDDQLGYPRRRAGRGNTSREGIAIPSSRRKALTNRCTWSHSMTVTIKGGQAMATSTAYELTEEQAIFSFGPEMVPALEVDPGTVVKLKMKDGLGNQLTREDQLIRDLYTDIDLTRVNGSTGPIFVRTAEPGDSLIVQILEIRLAATGVAFATPGIGQLHNQLKQPVTTIFHVEGDTIMMNERISFAAKPMLGLSA